MVSVEQNRAARLPAMLAVMLLLALGSAGSFGMMNRWLMLMLAIPASVFACWTILQTNWPTAAQVEARRAKQRLESFFNYAPIALSLSDMDGTMQIANSATAQYFGLDPEQLVGSGFSDMMSHWPESRLSAQGLIDRLAAGRTLHFSAKFDAPQGGGQREMDMTFFPIRDASGKVVEIGNFAIDVTDQRQAQEALAEQQANLLAFFDYAPLQVYITDLDHKIVMVNDWVYRETGADVYKPENVLGLSADQMVPSSWAEMSHDNDATVVEKGGVTQVEVRGQFGGKERDIVSIRFPIKDTEGNVIRIGGFVVDVSEQVNARREADNARAMLQAFSDNVPAGLSIKDRDRSFTMINEFSARRYYAAKPTELIGKNAEDIRTRRHGDHLYAMEQLVLDSGQPQTREVAYRAADGQQRHMHLMFFPITGENGEVTHIGSLTNDITEHRQDQLELTQSRAMLQAFFENIPAMTFIISLDRRYVSANRYALDHYGFEFLSPENLIGQPDITGTPPHWHDVIKEAHRTVVEEGKPYVNETSIDLPQGSFNLLVSRFPIRNTEGVTTHVGGLIFDRTAERQAEAALAEREAMLQAFFDNLPGLAFLSSNEGEIIAANSFMTEHFGIPNMRSENLVGKKGRDLLPPSWSAQADSAIEANEKTGTAFAFDQTIKLPDGKRHVSNIRFPIRNKEGETTHVGGLVFDRTVEKEAADAISAAREGLHQSEKLAALGQLLAGVAHELNNPLAIVMGRAAMLKDKLAGTAHEDSIQRLRDAADRCARIVKTFITMARQTGPQRTMVQIPDLIEAALDMTGHGLRAAGIALELQIEPDLPELTADGDQLIQVLMNLIINGQHAMAGQQNEPKLLITARQEAGTARILVEISDNGSGVADDVAARIFDPFFTTKDVGVGTGLGLSVCQSMIEAHGGTLELTRPVLGGATFRIGLPPGEAEVVDRADAKPAVEIPYRGSALVVDDEQEVADILAEMLDEKGMTCRVVTSGQAALEALAEQRFDAIFSDIRMPRMGGSELLAAIERDYPDMIRRIIFATGDVLHPEVDALRKSGRPIVEKPYDPEQLRAALLQLHEIGETP
ncbi:MAG: PAS domain-containing protein [Sphingomonadales bacterium]|jgi:PAS domain S-box-containing protein|uniref:PAS domain-containing protein n=3 Tax=Sphingorhabdus sp. TaxID=1902408 RepID=UPI003BB0B436|nr:PAS domain-containing protein [Sphingomonadales bacterium]